MTYAYARVSTTDQKLDRQINEFKKLPQVDKIFCEQQSGKDFASRRIYQLLKMRLKKGDILVIVSIDRLGRNYEQILKEWREITEKGCDIQVLDMPILNTSGNVEGLDGKFISQLVLQILAYVSEKEREKIKERQRQGIESAKKKGVAFGRPPLILPSDWNEIVKQYRSGEITGEDAASKIGRSTSTFYRLIRTNEEKAVKN